MSVCTELDCERCVVVKIEATWQHFAISGVEQISTRCACVQCLIAHQNTTQCNQDFQTVPATLAFPNSLRLWLFMVFVSQLWLHVLFSELRETNQSAILFGNAQLKKKLK